MPQFPSIRWGEANAGRAKFLHILCFKSFAPKSHTRWKCSNSQAVSAGVHHTRCLRLGRSVAVLIFMIHVCCDLPSPRRRCSSCVTSHTSCSSSLGYGNLPHSLGCNFNRHLSVFSFLALLREVQPRGLDRGSPAPQPSGQTPAPHPPPRSMAPLQSQKRKSEFEARRGFEDCYHSFQMRTQSG